MTHIMTQSIDQILGKIERERTIPGIRPGESEKVRYVSFDRSQNPSEIFEQVVLKINPPIPSRGGVSFSNAIIALPDGTPFYALKYHGDLCDWQVQIEQGALGLGALSAKLDGDRIIISDGRSYPLAECSVER